MMISRRHYTILAFATTLLALLVIVLGAYVRLTDAGLGCPDWPGCYGTLTVPRGEQSVQAANVAFPQRPVESGKAWREMLHRYVAGVLGLAVLALCVLAWRRRAEPGQPLWLPLALLAVVVFQAALGMWTVTLLLKPAVVTAHLLGGMLTAALLCLLTLRSAARSTPGVGPAARFASERPVRGNDSLRRAAMLGVAVLAAQIALGGWTSTNYAALACPDFPTCHGEWLPWADVGQAFRIWHGTGQDFEGGVLGHAARVTVHVAHRLGAVLTFLYIGGLLLWVWRAARQAASRCAAVIVAGLLATQVGLGVANVVLSLPLSVAVAHNGVAALLLLGMVSLVHMLRHEGAAPVPAVSPQKTAKPTDACR